LEIETWQKECPMSNIQLPIIKDERPTDGLAQRSRNQKYLTPAATPLKTSTIMKDAGFEMRDAGTVNIPSST